MLIYYYFFVLVDSVVINDSYQKLNLEESTNKNIIIVEQNEPVKISAEEHNASSKNKNVLDRIVKTVGNISIKIIPQNWNKKKKKVKCTSI